MLAILTCSQISDNDDIDTKACSNCHPANLPRFTPSIHSHSFLAPLHPTTVSQLEVWPLIGEGGSETWLLHALYARYGYNESGMAV